MAPDQQTKAQATNQLMQLIKDQEAGCIARKAIEQSSAAWKATDQSHCPTTWDGGLCWPRTAAGVLQKLQCPQYIPTFNHQEFATKLCTGEGHWFVNETSGQTWTNYSMCRLAAPPTTQHPALVDSVRNYLPIIKVVSLIGYAASLIALVLALIILFSIKRLRCPRNTLHMHLFVSFLLRAAMTLLKQILFSISDGIGHPNSVTTEGDQIQMTFAWECKLVVSIWQYAILANYFWILMEGLYLFNLIFFAPFSDSSAITLYVVLGWGCPLVVVTAWVLARIYWDNTLCWTVHDNPHTVFNLFYIIQVPIIVSIILNFILFLCIVWVLLVKLSSSVSIETRKYRYRKWAKSTLVLVPLFGVHYALLMALKYYANDNIDIEVIWLLCDQLFASFQGFFVSILYCLLNGEVRSELRKLWVGYWRSIDEGHHSRNIPMMKIRRRFKSTTTGDSTMQNDFTEEQQLNDTSCYEEKRLSNCKPSIPRTVVEEC